MRRGHSNPNEPFDRIKTVILVVEIESSISILDAESGEMCLQKIGLKDLKSRWFQGLWWS